MTFQIALIGKDGVVVGSDRRVSFRSPSPNLVDRDAVPWQFLPASKFVKSADESLVCACAGGPQSKTIANAFISEWEKNRTLRQAEWENSLRTTAEAVLGNSAGDEVIVARKDQPNRVLLVTRDKQAVGIQAVETTICTGTSATARFLSATFWQPTTVRTLRRLALLTLGYAARERPCDVGDGFDLMTLEAMSGSVEWEQFQSNDSYIEDLLDKFSENSKRFIFRDAPEKT